MTLEDAGGPGPTTLSLALDVGRVTLEGDLDVPALPRAVVLFAHGSGSSRHSPRNRQVAAGLQQASMATLLFDLLTEVESEDRRRVFDIDLLGQRLVGVIDLLSHYPQVANLPLGLFGASTGAAAALDAAAARPGRVGAVVSRGGRPDLSGRASEVRAPVLFVVGGEDHTVLHLNRDAAASLAGDVALVVIDGAGHLFEGPGELEQVTDHAVSWFRRHLGGEAPW